MKVSVTQDTKQLDAFVKHLEGMKGMTVNVGFFEDSKYDSGVPVAYVAVIQEFGSPRQGIPPRPFMRPTCVANATKWQQQFAKGSADVADGKLTWLQVFEQLGLKAAGDTRKTISKIQTPPLSPVTLQLRAWKKAGVKITKKSQVLQAAHLVALGINDTLSGTAAKPLIDSGVMRNAITHKVTMTDVYK